jgi:hypothetical protein
MLFLALVREWKPDRSRLRRVMTRRRHPYLVGSFLAALAATGAVCIACGAGATAQSAPSTTRPGHATAGGGRCPSALSPRAGDLALVSQRVSRSLPKIFEKVDTRRAVIYAALSLRDDERILGLRYTLYTRAVEKACGKRLVTRSWVVLVGLPRAPMASLVPALVYVARTPDGVRPWYLRFPNAGTGGFVGG